MHGYGGDLLCHVRHQAAGLVHQVPDAHGLVRPGRDKQRAGAAHVHANHRPVVETAAQQLRRLLVRLRLQ
eukprot:151623-Pyramimonas_sp.AAC.1